MKIKRYIRGRLSLAEQIGFNFSDLLAILGSLESTHRVRVII
jgi:hypothetical protein